MKNHRIWMLGIFIPLSALLACSLPSLGSAGGGDASPAPETPVGGGESQPTTASPGASGSGSVAGGGCDNPLYPVIAGASWAYTLDGAAPGNFTRSITAMTADGFTDQDVFESGATRIGQWKCDAGTLIALDPGSSSGATASVQASNIQANFQTTAMDGATFPAAVNAGTAWSQSFTIEGTQTINGQDVASKNQTEYSCTAGDTESVTVPAGTFNAVRVECQTAVHITITMNGQDIPTSVSTTSTAWYAPGVGMVKTVSILSDGSTSTIALTSYNIP